jgi:hypothetical protein
MTRNERPLPMDIEPEFSFEGANYRASIHVELKTAPGGVRCGECSRPIVAPTKFNVPDHGVKICKVVVNGLFSTDGMYDIDLEREEAKEVTEHLLSALRKPSYICGNCFPKLERTLSK